MAKHSPQQLYGQAIELHRSGQLAAAEKKYREVLRLAPAAADVHNSHGAALAALDRPQEAMEAFRRAARLDPRNPQALNNLGNSLKALGKLKEAIAQYQQAILLKPDHAPALYHLALALTEDGDTSAAKTTLEVLLAAHPGHAQALNSYGLLLKTAGNIDEAKKYFMQARHAAPDFIEAQMNLGLMHAMAEEWQEAIEIYYAACQAQPNFVDAFIELGKALFASTRHEDALESFDRALQLAPGNLEGHVKKSEALQLLNRSAEAIACLRAAILLPDATPDTHIALAQALQQLGQFDEAVATYRAIIQQSPECIAAYTGLSSSAKFTAADIALGEQLETQLLRTDIIATDRTSAHFSLGKFYDDLKIFDRAMPHYLEGNALRQQDYPDYTQTAHQRRVAALIEAFSANFFDQSRVSGSNSEQPILVVGMPRSGTTLTEQILASHPVVSGAGEVQFWASEAFGEALAAELSDDTPYPQCISLLNAPVVEKFANRYLGELHRFAGDPTAARIVDKMPGNFLALGLVATLFPRAKVIHIKRDAMDNCLSIFFQNFSGKHPYAYNLGNLGHYYLEYERLMAHWRNVLPAGFMHEVRYEDLVAEPEQSTRQMLEFLGLPWDERCLQPQNTVKAVRTASIWQARQPVYKTSVQRWKNYEPWLAPLKEALGYQES